MCKCFLCGSRDRLQEVDLADQCLHFCPECGETVLDWVKKCKEATNDDCSRQEDSGSARG